MITISLHMSSVEESRCCNCLIALLEWYKIAGVTLLDCSKWIFCIMSIIDMSDEQNIESWRMLIMYVRAWDLITLPIRSETGTYTWVS